jgi:hypothetical protein
MFNMDNMIWHKRFTAFVILFLLLSTFVAAVHHHDNTANDHDCPICLVSQHQHATSQTAIAFDGVPFFLETLYVTSAPVIIEKIFTSFQSDRAPPA